MVGTKKVKSLAEFRICASALAVVRAVTYVEAESAEAAQVIAKSFFDSGDAEWKYDGVNGDSLLIDTVQNRG